MDGNGKIKDQVVKMMLPRIEKLAKHFSQPGRVGLEFDDLVSEGAIEVILKAERFDPDHKSGANLKTMLTHVIRNRYKNLLRQQRRQVSDTDLQNYCNKYMGTITWDETETVADTLRDELPDDGARLLDGLMGKIYHARRAKHGLYEKDLGRAAHLSDLRRRELKTKIQQSLRSKR